MCGIFGWIGDRHIERSLLKVRLTASLRHRGPDDQRDFLFENTYLFHARLAILDIKAGIQPMTVGANTIIFNGQIYNHLVLRQKYALDCDTRSDTETILKLYEKKGKDFLDDLDGMFAFAIFNQNTKKLFIARDRAGEKPLYYYHQKGVSFVFASELNSLYALLHEALSIDYNNLQSFIYQGFLSGSDTPYLQIKELLPGHAMELDCTNLEAQTFQYWNIEKFYAQPKLTLNTEAQLELLSELIQKSVKERLESSDIEVGTFLSGGIDSGLVTAFAAQHRSGLKTFTVSFDGAYDEGPLAAQVAKHLGTDHQEVRINFDDLSDKITAILSAYGEPFADDSAIPSYYVSEAAKKHLTVILNGDGADELFAGYRRYVPFRYFDLFKAKKNPLSAALEKATKVFSNEKKSKLNYLHRLIHTYNQPLEKKYLAGTTDTFTDFEYAFLQAVSTEKLPQKIQSLNKKQHGSSALDVMMQLDFELLLPGALLPKMDIAAMQHSLETRSPFLGKSILETAPLLPASSKIKGLTTKYILRQIAKKELPQIIASQPKRGFEIPLKKWMNAHLKTITLDVLGSKNAFSRQFLSADYMKKLTENKVLGLSEEKRAKQLFLLLSLEIWYKHLKKISA